MRRGKEIAQGSHASIAFLAEAVRMMLDGVSVHLPDPVVLWLKGSFTKVCVRVDSEEELLILHTKAMAAGIISRVITDAGRTEFNGVPTITACAIGPDYAEKIDPITGHLSLY